jgi:crossover junction endodeoxyribonuclease RuvC
MTKQKVWIGVDPGLSKTSPGGISWLNEDRTDYEVNYMPMTIRGIADLIKDIYLDFEVMFGTIEDIHATGGHNITGQVKMMSSKHYCEAIFATLGIPFGYVTPAKWQKEMLGTGFKSIKYEDKKKQRKERNKWLKDRSLETAQRLFPNAPIKLKKDDGKSDSILIAKYGKDFL